MSVPATRYHIIRYDPISLSPSQTDGSYQGTRNPVPDPPPTLTFVSSARSAFNSSMFVGDVNIARPLSGEIDRPDGWRCGVDHGQVHDQVRDLISTCDGCSARGNPSLAPSFLRS